MSTTEQDQSTDQRAAEIAGLHELAEFLDGHPDIPIPHLGIHTAYQTPGALVSWICGLDDLRIEPGIISSQRKVFRTFAGLDVALHVRASRVGEVRQVPTVADEFTPFTADEIRDRAL